jgi:hypothetical protein
VLCGFIHDANILEKHAEKWKTYTGVKKERMREREPIGEKEHGKRI